MDAKIVYHGNIDGEDIVFRYPFPDDAIELMNYDNALSRENTFIRMQGEEKTIEDEQNFLTSVLESIKNKKAVVLFAVKGKKIIGVSNIELGDLIESHVGTFGITIAKEYRGRGLGKLLMTTIEKEALENLPDLEIIELGVFANNDLAISVYKKAGFIEEGRLPKGIKLENGYVDHIYMYKMIK